MSVTAIWLSTKTVTARAENYSPTCIYRFCESGDDFASDPTRDYLFCAVKEPDENYSKQRYRESDSKKNPERLTKVNCLNYIIYS